mmetsp:Transcript_17003/g.36636  ORF Transcript_17003/g.36636 Transcript_17003/m.36636 type:complete len:113 (-) Transcript_17003:148-486(-)
MRKREERRREEQSREEKRRGEREGKTHHASVGAASEPPRVSSDGEPSVCEKWKRADVNDSEKSTKQQQTQVKLTAPLRREPGISREAARSRYKQCDKEELVPIVVHSPSGHF